MSITKYRAAGVGCSEKRAANIIDVAFNHPIRLIVNALGVPPAYMLEMAKDRGVPTGALVGAKHHALKQAEVGVDILIVAGGEAGGHCGDVSTMVLVPEVAEARRRFSRHNDSRSRGYCDRQADGGSYGDGCPWSFGLAPSG